MVATRCPALSSPTVICMEVVDLPDPPFSLPSTMTCADRGYPTGASCIVTFDNPCGGLFFVRAAWHVRVRHAPAEDSWLSSLVNASGGSMDRSSATMNCRRKGPAQAHGPLFD